ncbi:deoxyribose-phosphate aldolase [Halosimplex carlsbadense 2-9-1]|uniref:Deoxyribose-phosphate aldolase n=1 Tax=Halosimplex carlsbadense 2-9-1 TaxID=797114 RepID=M0D0G1_9EURY|nr:deoxyribose-phosphate aldolase [Halosimplex carlsbadense]ELZ28162.1 deoxyribose-phosphate aldolase [Halosimplex carlsbadense 2-9-1]
MTTDAADLTGRIEHTVLGPETTPDDVIGVLDAAIEYGLRACIPPCYLELADGYAPTVPLSTVVGFPHGQHTTATKVEEAEDAWEAGADELDMVINVGRLRADEDGTVTNEIEEVVAAVPVPVKVIVETPLLSDAEKRRAAECALAADADYLKTATGFSDGGATVPDVELLAEYLPVKASGGIGSWAEMEAMLDAGAERIGASSGDTIAREFLDQHETAERSDVSGWE